MKRIITFFIVLLAVCQCVSAQSTIDKINSYIDKYSSLAVQEMYRSGIPASITLAQGILESGNGESVLAVEGKNHFGIKCHSDWTGERIYADDDAKGECFRKYPQVEDSYKDHSDFLRFKPRYQDLFSFDLSDYKSWAHGLKRAGYATDPKYADKLISMIERFDLSRFDKLDAVAQEQVPESPEEIQSPVRFEGSGLVGTCPVSLKRELMQINSIPFIYARAGETYRTISKLYDLFPKELASFNDDPDPDRRLTAGEMVFLQKKANKSAKGLEKHICSQGESLRGISQKYAVRLNSLMKRNSIKDADMPLSEDYTIYLR